MWFATRRGISCYTGLRFVNYNMSDGLQTYSYAFLAIDKKGALWALPQSGKLCVLKFSDGMWETQFYDSTLKQSSYFTAFNVFYQDDKVVVAAGAIESGLFIWRDGVWENYRTDNSLENDRINGIASIGDAIYIATAKGLSVIHDRELSEVHAENIPYLRSEILALQVAPSSLERSDTVIWMLGQNWLGTFSNGVFHLVTSGFHIPVKDIGNRCFLTINNNGEVYFGNPIYVYYYSERTGEIIELDRNSGLITNGGTSALTDREGNLWVTGFRGITKIPSRRFRQYSEREGLFSNEVASALEISPGHYVFGHHGAITYYDGIHFTPYRLSDPSGKGEFENRVQDMDVDGFGNLWMAVSANGIAHLTKEKQLRWYGEPEGLNGTAYTVLVASDGSIFAGTNKGLFLLSMGRFVKQVKVNDFINNGIRKIFQGPDNSIYLALFSRGIIRLSGDSILYRSSAENPLANNVYSVFFDKLGRGWAGTASGLYSINDSVLNKADTGDLVIDRPIYLILQDHNGCLWFGTDNGAYRWNGEKLDHFNVNDGFSGLEVNRDAGFEDHRNQIWFGTNNGVTKFNPEFDYKPGEIPPPIITLQFVETDGDTLSISDNLVLSSNQNNLDFHFNIASFIDENQVFYQCKLEGFDEGWSAEVFSHNNSYRYNNLTPGTYRFCIKARNSIGIWSEPICSGMVRIKYPFWAQWWFILLVAAFVISLLFFLTRLVVIRRYNLKLTKMVAIRTRALRRSELDLKESNESKDNFFSIIAHDLKSPFNAILGMLDLLTTEYEEFTDKERHRILMNLKTASTRTIALIENLLTWALAQKGLLPFEPEKFDMMELIHENVSLLEPNAKTKRINLLLPLSENVVIYGDRNMINTVIRNLISNAIKFTYPNGDVTITVERDSGQDVTVAVIDNGCGMDENALKNLFILDKRTTTKGTGNETGTGLGLILSKDFISKNNGKIWVESKPEAGSTFYFTLPVDPPGKRKDKKNQ